MEAKREIDGNDRIMTLTYVRLKSQNERMEAIFERILAAKFEELMKDTNMQEAEYILRR